LKNQLKLFVVIITALFISTISKAQIDETTSYKKVLELQTEE